MHIAKSRQLGFRPAISLLPLADRQAQPLAGFVKLTLKFGRSLAGGLHLLFSGATVIGFAPFPGLRRLLEART